MPANDPNSSAFSKILGFFLLLIALLSLAACDSGGGTPSGGSPSSSSSSSSQGPENQVPKWVAAAPASVKQVVTTTADGTSWVRSADLDGDGDQDLLSAAKTGTLTWYQSDGAAEPNFTEWVIADAPNTTSVGAADLDGDGDLDLVLSLWSGNGIVWYENSGGLNPEFTKREVSTDSLDDQLVFAEDLDGDGDLDLLIASNRETEYGDGLWGVDDRLILAWYENDGSADPVFTKQVISIMDYMPTSLFTADLDGDGDLDLLSIAGYGSNLIWYENDGAGDPEFIERTIDTYLNNLNNPHFTIGADLNGDGDLDLVSASTGDETVVWNKNKGSVQPDFTQRVLLEAARRNDSQISADGFSALAAADVDGDGDLDLLSTSFLADTITWYENDGAENPTFSERLIATDADGASSVFATDVDGDGKLDLLSASTNDDTIAWYRLPQRLHWLAEGETLSVIEDATDADGDVLSYAISQGADAHVFSIDSASGELTFANALPISEPADANRDNVYEVWISVTDGISIINRSVAVRVYVDDGDADNDRVPDAEDAFPFDPSESVDTDMDGIGNNADRDDDGDGIEDEADQAPLDASSSFPPEWLQAPHSPAERVIVTDVDVYQWAPLIAEDLNGDGDLDLLTASSAGESIITNTITWQENDGATNPTFTTQVVIESTDEVMWMVATDIDRDEDMDVLVASRGSLGEAIVWYENDGADNPKFTGKVLITGVSSLLVAAADMDGDGDLDLLSRGSSAYTFSWYENDGSVTPSFSERVIFAASYNTRHELPEELFVADVDGDGDLDVLFAARYAHAPANDTTVGWYENSGTADPEFFRRVITTSAPNVFSVSAADLDQDGDMDLLSQSSRSITWYENNGAVEPEFTERVITTTRGGQQSIFAIDMDGDGDLDLLPEEGFDTTTVWYQNDGAVNPIFIEQHIILADDARRSLVATDIDGDRNLELLSAAGFDGTIAWYRTTQRRYQVNEGQTLTALENATDMDGNLLTYAVSHGPDANFFTMDATEGELTFSNAPSVSAPEDANGDNVYEVWISVTDGFSTLNRSVAVEVQAAN